VAKAADCKSAIVGSTPTGASPRRSMRWLAQPRTVQQFAVCALSAARSKYFSSTH